MMRPLGSEFAALKCKVAKRRDGVDRVCLMTNDFEYDGFLFIVKTKMMGGNIGMLKR
jgi:hypothetical protein